ncbi:MAG: hypothetical protein JSU86_07045, partial [Phycisphaerales bacterium]
ELRVDAAPGRAVLARVRLRPELREEPCFGHTATHSFNMGTDFGVGGKLRVVAVADDGAESAPYTVRFDVIPPPVGIPALVLKHDSDERWLTYVAAQDITLDSLSEGVGWGMIPEDIPGFGAREFKFVSLPHVDLDITGDGTSRAPLFEAGSDQPTKVAGIELTPRLAGTLWWEYVPVEQEWLPGGTITFDLTGGYQSPATYTVFFVGPIPVPAYWRMLLETQLNSQLDVWAWLDELDVQYAGTLDWRLYAEIMLGLGVADLLALEGYLGGGAVMRLQFPEEPTLEKLRIYLSGGVRIVVWIWSWEQPLLDYWWDLYGSGLGQLQLARMPDESEFKLMPRDYMDEDYAVFVGNSYGAPAAGVSGVLCDGTTETPIQLNVFPESTPQLAAIGDELLAPWVHDDPSRTSVNRTEIVFARKHEATWSVPEPVGDDGTADFHPQIAALAGGDALVVWEDAAEVLIDPGEPDDPCAPPCEAECAGDPDPPVCEAVCRSECKLEEMKGKMEITVARYDGASGIWSSPTTITDNTILDHSPRIATAADGRAMLTWISNAGNELLGTGNNPNNIHYVLYDGANWRTPAVAATGVRSIIKSAMAFDGTDAVILFTGDPEETDQRGNECDPDYGPSRCQELFALTYDGSSWSEVMQLTADEVEDANPQLAYDENGNLVLVWYSNGDLVMSTDLGLIDRRVIVDLEGAGSGAADFRLGSNTSGQLALVWQEISAHRVDLWYATYDCTFGVWSKPQQLTNDALLERGMSPALDAAGTLAVVYNKVHVHYETRTIERGGEHIVVDNVPVPGQTDLYELRHEIVGDLAVEARGITVSPPNPSSGSVATLTATVRNICDAPALFVVAYFYDGDPADDGTLIDAPVEPGP